MALIARWSDPVFHSLVKVYLYSSFLLSLCSTIADIYSRLEPSLGTGAVEYGHPGVALLPLLHPSHLVSAALFLVWGHHSQTLSHHHLVSWYDSSRSCSGWSHRHHLAQSWSNCTFFVASPLGCCDSVEQTSQHGTSTTALVGSSWKCSSITARRHFPARSAMANL